MLFLYETDDDTYSEVNKIYRTCHTQTFITTGNNSYFESYTGNHLVLKGDLFDEKITQTLTTGKVCGDIYTN